MSTAALDLLTTLRARGVELVAVGDRLRFRPAEALAPEEVERLRGHKAELLRLLAEPPTPLLRLDPGTVRAALGDSPAPDALRALEAEVRAALAQLAEEIRSGQLGPGPILIRGRPVGDWLPLEHVAALLSQAQAPRPWQQGGGR